MKTYGSDANLPVLPDWVIEKMRDTERRQSRGTHRAEGVILAGERCDRCRSPKLTTTVTQTGPFGQDPTVKGATPDVAFRNRYGVEFKRTIWHARACQDCRARQGYVAKVAGKPKEKPEVRQDIVDAIRRLKASGWRFPWE